MESAARNSMTQHQGVSMSKHVRDDHQSPAAPPNLTSERTAAESAPAANSASPARVPVDDSQAAVCYANFCRVTGTPEELILDSGLNANPAGGGPVEIKQRLILNYYTAKRLLQALHLSVQRHEQAFGALETDVQKRVVPRVRSVSARSQA
jgi:Protein of unknown function (DUF3467)